MSTPTCLCTVPQVAVVDVTMAKWILVEEIGCRYHQGGRLTITPAEEVPLLYKHKTIHLIKPSVQSKLPLALVFELLDLLWTEMEDSDGYGTMLHTHDVCYNDRTWNLPHAHPSFCHVS